MSGKKRERNCEVVTSSFMNCLQLFQNGRETVRSGTSSFTHGLQLSLIIGHVIPARGKNPKPGLGASNVLDLDGGDVLDAGEVVLHAGGLEIAVGSTEVGNVHEGDGSYEGDADLVSHDGLLGGGDLVAHMGMLLILSGLIIGQENPASLQKE